MQLFKHWAFISYLQHTHTHTHSVSLSVFVSLSLQPMPRRSFSVISVLSCCSCEVFISSRTSSGATVHVASWQHRGQNLPAFPFVIMCRTFIPLHKRKEPRNNYKCHAGVWIGLTLLFLLPSGFYIMSQFHTAELARRGTVKKVNWSSPQHIAHQIGPAFNIRIKTR